MAIISILLQFFGVLGLIASFVEPLNDEMKRAMFIQALLFWSVGYILWLYY